MAHVMTYINLLTFIYQFYLRTRDSFSSIKQRTRWRRQNIAPNACLRPCVVKWFVQSESWWREDIRDDHHDGETYSHSNEECKII